MSWWVYEDARHAADEAVRAGLADTARAAVRAVRAAEAGSTLPESAKAGARAVTAHAAVRGAVYAALAEVGGAGPCELGGAGTCGE